MAGADRVREAPIRLYDLGLDELESYVGGLGEPSYRAQQVWEWLYVHLADSVHQMTNLPGALRERLVGETTLRLLEVVETARSADGRTRKDLLRLPDGETIEAVLMRYERRRTACLSTQVGCALGVRSAPRARWASAGISAAGRSWPRRCISRAVCRARGSG